MKNNEDISPTDRRFFDPPNSIENNVVISIENNTTEPNQQNPTCSNKATNVRFTSKVEQHHSKPYPNIPIEEEDSEEEEEEEEDVILKREKMIQFIKTNFNRRVNKRVLKCTIAYFLTALFSLVRPLTAAFEAPFLTTTGMLFSHPGRSMGAQIDITITAVLGVIAAVIYTIIAIGCTVLYNQHYPNTTNDRYISAFFLFFGILGSQLLRQLYPKFFFFSLQFMTIQIFCMTRAVGYTTMPYSMPINYGIPLIIGHGISLAVNLLIWPETAVDGLGRALKGTVSSSRNMLNLLTKQFFLDPHSEPVAECVVDEIAKKMRNGMTKVKTAYREAKYEVSYAFIEPQQLAEVRKSLGRLTRHLSILGKCLKTERELFESAIDALNDETNADSDSDTVHNEENEDTSTKQPHNEEEFKLMLNALRNPNESTANTTPFSSKQNSRLASATNSDDEDITEQNQKSVSSFKSFLSLPRLSMPTPMPPKKSKKQTDYSQRRLLLTYLLQLKDPLMELALDCASALDCIYDSIASELEMDQDSSFWFWKKKKHVQDDKALERHGGNIQCNCSQNIRLAIHRFDNHEKHRMESLCKFNDTTDELDLSLRPELFLVFFFIFTIREVANELQEMTLAMDELRLSPRKSSFTGKKKKHLYIPGMNWKVWQKWAKGNNHTNTKDKGGYSFSTLTTFIPKEETRKQEVEDNYNLTKIKTNGSIMRQRSRKESIHLKNESVDQSPAMVKRNKRPQYQKPENSVEHKPKTEKKKKKKAPLLSRLRYEIWLKFQFFDRYEFKFAFKMATAVLILCVPALIPSTADWYVQVRGQWAALTVTSIMNPTSGGTLEAGFWRIVGTFAGAFTGWGALAAGDGSPYLLGVFAALLAIPSFYIHLASTYSKVGMVTLTTYEVVALSRYANPPENETIQETVWKRTITMIVGICVALLLNSLVWPFVARHMVRKSIAGCMGQLEDYYIYILGNFLYHNPSSTPSNEEIAKGEKMENKIQSAIEACDVLLDLTDHEPRFRGPFPKLFYKEMIICMGNILDRLLSTRLALLQMPIAVKNDICAKPYHVDRKYMTASILLSFHTLASSLRAKGHLPVYMPSAREARDKLIDHRRSDAKATNWIRFRNLTWFAMSCCSEEIIEEIEYLTVLIRYIVGENEYTEQVVKIDQYIGINNDCNDEKSLFTHM